MVWRVDRRRKKVGGVDLFKEAVTYLVLPSTLHARVEGITQKDLGPRVATKGPIYQEYHINKLHL